MNRYSQMAAVFLICCVALSWGVWDTGIGSGEIDPVLRYGAQDEAIYTREAINMSVSGNWMTPMLMGRPVLEKPPLLIWMMALAMKVFGVSRFTARIPGIGAGAFVCTACWWIARRVGDSRAGWIAGLLALTSQIVFTMARHAMTDIVLTAGTLIVIVLLLRDPALRARSSMAGIAIAVMGCLLTKSIAGLLPLAVLLVVGAAAKPDARAPWTRVAVVAASSVLGAGVWFAYCFAQHRRWFLADMGFQLLTVGAGEHQTSSENHILFYLKRLVYSDGVSLLLFATAVPAFGRALRARRSEAVLLGAYLLVYGGALAAFRFHSEQYLCWLIPAILLVGASYAPIIRTTWGWGAAPILIALFSLRLFSPDSAWGLSVERGSTLPAATLLTSYCEERRAIDLYILDVGDEFYGAVLPLQHVRYGWIDPTEDALRQHPYLGGLGILLRADEVAALTKLRPEYRRRLLEWGIDSAEPIGTGMVADSEWRLSDLVKAHPESDFLISGRVMGAIRGDSRHKLKMTKGDYVLLESEQSGSLGTPAWTCAM